MGCLWQLDPTLFSKLPTEALSNSCKRLGLRDLVLGGDIVVNWAAVSTEPIPDGRLVWQMPQRELLQRAQEWLPQ